METRANLDALRSARERKGLMPQQVAVAVGISAPHAWDLAVQEDEAATTLSLAQLARLCGVMDLRLQDLFPKTNFAVAEPLSLAHLREQIEVFCRSAGLSIEQFGDKAGWDVCAFMKNPEAAMTEWNLDCMCDVCRTISAEPEPYLKGMIVAEQRRP